MKIFDIIVKFFQKVFGKENTYLIEVQNEVKKDNSDFSSEIKILDEKLEKNELNNLLVELKTKNEVNKVSKADLIKLQQKMDNNMNILLTKNQKQYEDIRRYSWELAKYKKSLKNETAE